MPAHPKTAGVGRPRKRPITEQGVTTLLALNPQSVIPAATLAAFRRVHAVDERNAALEEAICEGFAFDSAGAVYVTQHGRDQSSAFIRMLVPTGMALPQLPVPPGGTAAQVALGERIYHGQADGGTCVGCHGSDGNGTPLAPSLTSGKWLWSDGSLAALTHTITEGVPAPKQYRSAMPPKGGAQLSDSDLAAVAAYVWSLGHPKGQ